MASKLQTNQNLIDELTNRLQQVKKENEQYKENLESAINGELEALTTAYDIVGEFVADRFEVSVIDKKSHFETTIHISTMTDEATVSTGGGTVPINLLQNIVITVQMKLNL